MSGRHITQPRDRLSAKYRALHAKLADELRDHFSGRIRNHARDSKTFKLRGALRKELL